MKLTLLPWALIFFCFIASVHLVAQDKDIYFSLTGHLDQKKVDNAINLLKTNDQGALAIELSSSSGEILPVLELAQSIYQYRWKNHAKIVVYIDKVAIGPAAIIPFLADEIITSFLVTWGDISYSDKDTVPVNVLRSQVKGLINPSQPKAALFNLLAEGMVDPSIEIIDDDGLKIHSDNNRSSKKIISYKGETLVLDQNQLKELDIVSQFTSPEQFVEKYTSRNQNPRVDFPKPASEVSQESKTEIMNHLKSAIKYNEVGLNRIGYITITDKDTINQGTWIYVKNALDEYKKNPPIFIILELNTPGGEVFAAQEISDALKEMDTTYGVPIVAYIHNWAISAGAMLAYSCRFISISKDASMGAAEPVIASETGEMKSASEKVNSALRTDFANRALFFDRNPLIAEAMVDKDLILVLRHGQVIKLDNEKQIITTGMDPDKLISPKGKLLTLDAKELMEYGVADILLLPTKLIPITQEEKAAGEWPADKTQLFQYPFFSYIPDAKIVAYKMDWKERFFSWLANPIVSSLLFLGLMIGFYVEFNTPGFGLPGLVGLTCLLLIILSSFSIQATHWLEVIILVIGIILVAAEIFIFPGFGIPGVLGVLLTVAGLFLMMLPNISKTNFTLDPDQMSASLEVFLARLGWLCATFLLGMGVIYILAKYFMPKFSRFNRLILTGGEQESSQGYVAGSLLRNLPAIGSKGIVTAPLRPSGKVIIDDTLYDAVSNGNFIAGGTSIEILRYEGSRMIVDELPQPSEIEGKE